MALQVEGITRQFTFEKDDKTINLADPNPSMSPEEVVKFYAGTYPELTTASLTGPKINAGKAEYSLAVNVGTKG